MRAAVVLFPGSNADSELVRALRDVVGVDTTVAWHRDAELPGATDLVAIPGGFSYGDYLRCGAIAKTSPIVAAVRRHAERGGLVLGICNGFQILTEAGLLPGALTRNAHLRFECRDVFVTPTGEGPFTAGLPRVLRLPIAHAEGRYQATEATLDALDRNERVAFRYCDARGNVIAQPAGRFASADAANPNGSARAIAGVFGGPVKNVLGLMPHPERACEALVGCEDGRLLFEAAVRACADSTGPMSLGSP